VAMVLQYVGVVRMPKMLTRAEHLDSFCSASTRAGVVDYQL
jgi:hypothetical protein